VQNSFDYFFGKSALQSYSNVKLEKLQSKIILGAFCLKETHFEVAF